MKHTIGAIFWCLFLFSALSEKAQSQSLDAQYNKQSSAYDKAQRWCRNAFNSAQYTGEDSDYYRTFITGAREIYSVYISTSNVGTPCFYERLGLVGKETKEFSKNSGCTYKTLYKEEGNELIKYWSSSCNGKVNRVTAGIRR